MTKVYFVENRYQRSFDRAGIDGWHEAFQNAIIYESDAFVVMQEEDEVYPGCSNEHVFENMSDFMSNAFSNVCSIEGFNANCNLTYLGEL